MPLVGTAPTNYNFVSGDYNRGTGLKGSGTKYLDSNRNNNADPQNSKHISTYSSETAGLGVLIGASSGTVAAGSTLIGRWDAGSGPYAFARLNSSLTLNDIDVGTEPLGFLGVSRNQSSGYNYRINGLSRSTSHVSVSPFNGNIAVFAETGGTFGTQSRLTFYSIGESLDLALLDTRVSNLITAIGGAI